MSEHATLPILKTLTIPMVGADDSGTPPWEQLRELYKIDPHLSAAAALMSASVLPYLAGDTGAVLAVAAILAVQLLMRFVADRRFRRRSADAAFKPWLDGFIIISIFSGIAWGASLAILYLGASPEAQVVVLAVGCGIVQSAAARAYMAPASTALVILIMIGIVNAAALSEGNWLMLPICLAYVAFQANYMRRLIGLEQSRFAAEQRTSTLLDRLAESNDKLRQANEQLMRHATTDGLTGLANRRSFDADLDTAMAEANRTGEPLSLLLIDIDHFKRFNDTHGHLAGDECLRRVGQFLVDECNHLPCHPARYGGEEFAIILPGAMRPEAEAFAMHLLEQASRLDLTEIAAQATPITLSIGIATARTHEHNRTLLDHADQGLYAAKQAGRNCVRSREMAAPIGTPA
ncbi:MAG: GGDEF domain-containing protein [Rhizobium sp.]|nr:GGDEF domain-containing protein [Rhizobium sp.]